MAAAYVVGVMTGSMPRRVRRMNGVEAEIRVGRVECMNVAGAIEIGGIHEPSDRIAGNMERGACVIGVKSNFVLAMSSGARISPANPDAETEIRRERRGDGEERTSSRAKEEGDGNEEKVDCVGSGSARTAQKKDLRNDAIVEKRTLCQNVLLVPFHTPQAPSSLHSLESTVVRDEVERGAYVWLWECGERMLRLDLGVEDDEDRDEEY